MFLGYVFLIMQFLCLFALIRVWWVDYIRFYTLKHNRDAYLKLVSYEQMMFRFWIWNIDRLQKNETNN